MRGCNSEEGKNTFDKTNFDGFHFIMADNKATPKLMAAYLSNSTINTVTFYAQKGTMYDGRDYLTVTLSDVKLTSYFHASNDKYSVPVVEVSMTFSKIHMEYNDGSAPVTAGWDFKTNTPF
jgi:type VI secretion system Hcp family effector